MFIKAYLITVELVPEMVKALTFGLGRRVFFLKLVLLVPVLIFGV